MTFSKLNILFVCSANDARSIIAESIVRKSGAGKFNVASAGIAPIGQLPAEVTHILDARNHNDFALRPKGLAEVDGEMSANWDILIGLGVMEHEMHHLANMHANNVLHWNIADPMNPFFDGEERKFELSECFRCLNLRLSTLSCLPNETLRQIAQSRRQAHQDIRAA